jgi:flagellar assembly protein FliH
VIVEADEFLRSLEREVLDLSLAIAEKVIEHEARSDRTIVLGVIRGALEEARGATIVEVRLNPEDFDLVATRWQEVAPESLLERGQLVADDRIQQGGCVIETQTGRVDAQLASKLERLRDAFNAVREGEPQ